MTGGGVSDTFTYNGLGLRVGKQDSTGTAHDLCDGASPGSPLLCDGYAVYTPGLSERRNATSSFYSNDKQGNLWTQNAVNGAQTYYQDTTAFGVMTAGGGSTSTPFRFGGGNGCQSDADTGLVLMGHRYYDPRTGRFITQDPAGDGDNWYTYAANNPANEIDPSGLVAQTPDDVQADLQHLYANPYYTDDAEINYSSDGSPYFKGTNGVTYGYTQLHLSGGGGGTTDAGMGFGGFIDNWGTFGTAALAGREWGAVDSGHGSRVAAVGASVLFAGAIVAAGTSRGGDAAAADAGRLVIGKLGEELASVGEGERTLLPMLQKNLGSFKLNWKQNAGALRAEMRLGNPIRDAHVDPITGELIPENYNSFFNAERKLLSSRGWSYDPKTTMWSP